MKNLNLSVTIILFAATGSAQVNPAAVTAPFKAQYNQYAQQNNFNAQAAAAQNGALKGTMIQLLGGLCTGFVDKGSAERLQLLGNDLDDAAYAERAKKGHMSVAGWDSEEARSFGAAGKANFSPGCNNFMNANGDLGPWGDYALGQIKNHSESFGENVPSDITSWCPKYPTLSAEQRERFWVWVLASMASSESSCNPEAEAQAKNGTALGLFQVWNSMGPASCQAASNLKNPNQNITCAIDQLAAELKDRETLTINRTGVTYWGVLRTDDWNKARGADVEGGKKTRALLTKFPQCGKS